MRAELLKRKWREATDSSLTLQIFQLCFERSLDLLRISSV